MKYATNRDNHQVTRFNFRNGWTASIVATSGGSSCAVWPTCKSAGTDHVDHVHDNANDDEVAEFLINVRRRGQYTPHYHAEATPHHIPFPSGESISGGEIRRELTEIRRLIMNYQEAFDALNTKIDNLGTAVVDAVSELRDLVSVIRDIAAHPAVPAEITDQLIALGARVDSAIGTLSTGVTEAKAEVNPAPVAPVEPTPEAPAEQPIETPAEVPAV